MGLLNLDWLRQMQQMQGGSAPLAFQPQSVGQAANNMQNLPMNNAMDGLRQSMSSPMTQMGATLMGASQNQGGQQEQDAMAQQSMAMFAQRRAQEEERRRQPMVCGYSFFR